MECFILNYMISNLISGIPGPGRDLPNRAQRTHAAKLRPPGGPGCHQPSEDQMETMPACRRHAVSIHRRCPCGSVTYRATSALYLDKGWINPGACCRGVPLRGGAKLCASHALFLTQFRFSHHLGPCVRPHRPHRPHRLHCLAQSSYMLRLDVARRLQHAVGLTAGLLFAFSTYFRSIFLNAQTAPF